MNRSLRIGVRILQGACALLFIGVLSGCLGNSNDGFDYTEWRKLNDAYFQACQTETDASGLVYDEISPVWDHSFSILMRWHNDRSLTAGSITPMSNSTVAIKYTLTNIDGDTLDSSASLKCQPNGMITGFWAALTNMHVTDTVTAVIPYTAGYGAYGSGGVAPFSTLIFGIRLDSIVAYEKK